MGVLTDRDLVVRCVASGKRPENTKVRDVMSGRVITAFPEMDAGVAAHLMGREQIRRLPVVEQGKLCGIVSIGDLAGREETGYDAVDALGEICSHLSSKE